MSSDSRKASILTSRKSQGRGAKVYTRFDERIHAVDVVIFEVLCRQGGRRWWRPIAGGPPGVSGRKAPSCFSAGGLCVSGRLAGLGSLAFAEGL